MVIFPAKPLRAQSLSISKEHFLVIFVSLWDQGGSKNSKAGQYLLSHPHI